MKSKQKRRIIIVSAIIVALLVIGGGVLFARSRFNIVPELVASHTSSMKVVSFPEIATDQLSPQQQKVVEILKQEYKAQPAGTKYSQGNNEPWCADFVSWVFNQAGVPLENPNNGYWRIPGTYTLREYYQSQNRFKAADSGYNPKVGDIMLYDNPSPFGQHTNIVIKNANGIVTTIGGNEPGGIRIVQHEAKEAAGFIGYGVF